MTNSQDERGDSLPSYAAMVVGVGMVGIAGAYWLTRSQEQRMGAFAGVSLAVLSGVVALTLKRLALERSVKWALGMIAVVFGLRLTLVAAGLVYVFHKLLSPIAFVVGFFGVYFALQWIEVGYVLTEMKRRGGGGF